MRRAGGSLVCLVLTLGLLAPWLVGANRTTLENRDLAAFPRLELGALHPSTYRGFDTALEDRLGLREHVIRRVGQSGLDVLGLSLTSDVHVGSGGQLFLTKDFTEPCPYLDRFDVDAVKARIDRWASVAAARGKELIVAIPPDKSTVHRAKLGPQGEALMACSDQVGDALRRAWGTGGDDSVVLLADEVAAIERERPGSTFQLGDAHWTEVGATAIVERLVELASDGAVPTTGELLSGGTSSRTGDLYTLLGFRRKDEVPNVDVRRTGVRTRLSSVDTPSGRGLRRFGSTSTGAPLIEGRTLVVRDSFVNAAESLLAPYFSDLTFLHWDDLEALAKTARNGPAYDRVIIENVQRGFARRAVEDYADPVLEDAIDGWLRR